MKKIGFLLIGVFLIVLFSIMVFAEGEIICSSDAECGEVTTTYATCKNETHICSTIRTPTCNNASTNISECETLEEETCWICENGCASNACLIEELPVCDSDNLDLCLNETNCTDIGGYWYNDTCNEEEEDDEDNNQTGNGNQGLGQTIRNRVKAGVYTSLTGEQIRVSELAQNRYRFEFGNISADTELEIEEETGGGKTKLKVKLRNGGDVEIKIMPGVASETALARLRLKFCSSDNNCTIELKEVLAKVRKHGNETQLAYEVQAERHAIILAMFRTKMQVMAEVDAETGELIRVKKPWWAFLASEPEE